MECGVWGLGCEVGGGGGGVVRCGDLGFGGWILLIGVRSLEFEAWGVGVGG